jgi:bacillolysin
MSKKKLVSLALGTSLVFSASFTGATTFAQSSDSITSKMDIHQKVMNIDKKGPSFLSVNYQKGL